MRDVSGGYSAAKRGIVTLESGQTVFVKIAVEEQTQKWLERELVAYHWLEKQQYEYAPRLIAEGANGFALPDFSTWDWADTWSQTKLDAVLHAMDVLAELSASAKGMFPENDFGDTPALARPWTDGPIIPSVLSGYAYPAREQFLEGAAELLGDKQLHKIYAELAATLPWRGDDLVHYDVRADNLAYDSVNEKVMLVDWNWLCFGSKRTDQTALLINAQWAGYDVLPRYADRLDKNSLAWFVGFWLTNATKEADTENLKRLRSRQLECAVVAHELLQAL